MNWTELSMFTGHPKFVAVLLAWVLLAGIGVLFNHGAHMNDPED
jgi:hypothetical protein